MSVSEKVQKTARILAGAVAFFMVALVVGVIWSLAMGEMSGPALAAQNPGLGVVGPVSDGVVYGMLAVTFVSVAVAEFTLWQVYLLLRSYGRAETLTAGCARQLRRIGFGMVSIAIAGVVGASAGSVILTSGNPEGQRALAISIGSNDVWVLLMGGLFIVIGWVMGDAVRIADENKGFV